MRTKLMKLRVARSRQRFADPSVLEDDDDDEAPDNLENDSDWSRDAATPTSIGSIPSENHDETQPTEKTYSKARWKRRRRNLVVKAEEDEGDDDTEKKIVPKSSNHLYPSEVQCPVDIAPSAQCFQYKTVMSNVQVAMNLYSDHQTDSEKYPCSKCEMRFPRSMDRRAHEWSVHRKADIKCPLCPKLLITPSGLTNHLHKFHHTELEYPCAKCEMVFTRYRARRAHERKVHGYFARPGNNVKLVNRTPKRPLGNVVVKQEIDEQSDKETKEAEQLEMGNSNQASKSGTKEKLKCPKCSKLFIDGRGLVNHLKMFHRTLIEYPCKTCGMSFKRQQFLRSHQTKVHGPGPGLRTCLKCSQVFPSRTELWRHHKKAHKVRRGARPVPSTCSKCSEVLPSRLKLRLHMRIAHRPKSLIEGTPTTKRSRFKSCPICSKKLSTRFKVVQHMDTLHENEKPEVEKTHYCCFCSQRYAYQETLGFHLNTYHSAKKGRGLKCDLESCKEKPLVSMEMFNEHLKSHLWGSEKISFCEKCNWGFLRQEIRDLHQLIHITADKDHRKLVCPQCPNTFVNLSGLQNHFNKTHGLNLKRFQCDQCDKSFFMKHSLQTHNRIHQSNSFKKRSNWKCDQCGVTFVDKDSFEKHIKSGHLFSCLEPGCDQKFDTKRKLMIHGTMKHLDPKRREWNCKSCPASYLTKGALKGHIRNYHTEIKFTCELCGATFKRKDHLKLHMDSNHNPDRVKSWICSLCGKSYHSVMGLQFHTDSEHKKESEWHLKCPHCPKRFYRNMYLYRHLKTCKGGEGDDKNTDQVQSTSSTTTSRKRKGPSGHNSGKTKVSDGDKEESSDTSTTISLQAEQDIMHGIKLSGGTGNASLNLNPISQGSPTSDVNDSPEALHQSWTSF